MGSSRKSILRTLAYSDIFDYPLTKDELWRFFIADSALSRSAETHGRSQVRLGRSLKSVKLERELGSLSSLLVKRNGFYCFKGRVEIIDKRLKREKESNKKLELARRIIDILSHIPTVYLIGISGALAMKNSDKDDDIDLFIVAKKNTLFLTRLLLLAILEVLGKRRRRNEKYAPNKICLNMLIDENILCLPKERQNLYGVHETIQMMPVFQRNNTYKKFIAANLWVRKFLPNAFRYRALINKRNCKKSFVDVVVCSIFSFPVFEFVARRFQLWYIGKHQTKETIKNNFLAFHPRDYKDKILSLYKRRLEKYKI